MAYPSFGPVKTLPRICKEPIRNMTQTTPCITKRKIHTSQILWQIHLSCTSMYIQGTITSSITTMISHESKNSFNLLSHHNHHQHMNGKKHNIHHLASQQPWIATSFNKNRSLLSTWILLSKHHRRFHRKASFFMPGFPCLKTVEGNQRLRS